MHETVTTVNISEKGTLLSGCVENFAEEAFLSEAMVRDSLSAAGFDSGGSEGTDPDEVPVEITVEVKLVVKEL